MLLLDTNILIYLLSGNKKVVEALNRTSEQRLAISTITRLEFLVGAHKEKLTNVTDYLDEFTNIPVTAKIVDQAAELYEKCAQMKFKDLVIGATAKDAGCKLLTADKGFSRILQTVDCEIVSIANSV